MSYMCIIINKMDEIMPYSQEEFPETLHWLGTHWNHYPELWRNQCHIWWLQLVEKEPQFRRCRHGWTHQICEAVHVTPWWLLIQIPSDFVNIILKSTFYKRCTSKAQIYHIYPSQLSGLKVLQSSNVPAIYLVISRVTTILFSQKCIFYILCYFLTSYNLFELVHIID